ncbi:MAG: TrmH family RNA methyltransferase [Anaerolineaceae bacterium]
MSARKSDLHRGELSILLDNVRSALNVGSIIRTCEGTGVKHIYLCGITPTPENPKVSKTALTSESMISWSYHLNALDITKQLKRSGNQVWSLEITPTSIPLDEAVRLKHIFPMILVAGNEQAGVDPGILAISDRIIYLPMIGIKRSLNVAVAVGAASTMLLSTSCV